NAVKSIVSLFDAPKKPTADTIINRINKIKSDVAPTANLVATIEGLVTRAADLINQSKVEIEIKKKMNNGQGLSTLMQDRLSGLRETLRGLETNLTPDDQNAVSEAYNESQRLSGDINSYM